MKPETGEYDLAALTGFSNEELCELSHHSLDELLASSRPQRQIDEEWTRRLQIQIREALGREEFELAGAKTK